MPIRGTQQLQDLVRRCERMSQPAFREGLNRTLAQEAQNQIQLGFGQQRDPLGRPWKPSARAVSQGGQTLSDTARLRRSFSAPGAVTRLSAQGFTIGTNVQYARIHQFGGTITPRAKKALAFQVGGRWVFAKVVKIPARPMLPEGRLGPIWGPAFQRAAEAYIRANA